MFRTLRSRLIFSHLLPIMIITPLIAVTLVYVIETRFLLQSLTQNLADDAKLLARMSQVEYQVWGDEAYFEGVLSRLQLDPAIQVMFIDHSGRLLYTTDPNAKNLGTFTLRSDAFSQAISGHDSVQTNYSGLKMKNITIDVYSPVYGPQNQMIGVVRLNYQIGSLLEQFSQLRIIIIGVTVAGLLLGVILGSILALSISRPIRRVTDAVYDLALGVRSESLPETGTVEIRDLSRSVNYLVAQTKSMEKARRQLLANLVHEIGRPLGAIRSAIHSLSTGAADDPQMLTELTKGLEETTKRMQIVLDELAGLHDQVLGTLELNLEPIALSEWLPVILSTWREAAREKGVEWIEEIPSDLPTVMVDDMRMAQVVGNLASNAIKYTPSGGKVIVRAGADKKKYWISFLDNGLGISDEEQQRIFEPFYRGDQGRRIKQGMGLGLSIARNLVLAHQGRIEVRSKLGEGSEFTVWLPMEQRTSIN